MYAIFYIFIYEFSIFIKNEKKMRNNFPSNLMEKVRSLCQDTDAQIRKIMVTDVLERIAFAIGTEKTEIYLLEKVFKYKIDEILIFKINFTDYGTYL